MKKHILRVKPTTGIQIPKSLLDEAQLEGDVEVAVRNQTLVIQKPTRPRQGWAAFRAMAEQGVDEPLDGADSFPNSWDEEEWEW